MRRLPLMFALAAVTLLALPAVAAAADPTPVPVVDASSAPAVDPSAVPPVDPSVVPVVDPTADPAVTPSGDPTTVSPGNPGSTPAEPPVACAPDAPDCVIIPIVGVPLPCPTGSEVCPMGVGVTSSGPGASDQPLGAPAPLPTGPFFSITKISDGTTTYDVQGNITMTPDGISATVGCNTIAAPATWDAEKGVLTITGSIVSTKMACEGDPGAAEALLVQLLGAGTVSFDGTALTGAGVTADATIAMADGLAPVDISLTMGNGPETLGATAGSGAATPAAPVAAAKGNEALAGTVLLLTAAAMMLFLVAGGLIARRASRQS